MKYKDVYTIARACALIGFSLHYTLTLLKRGVL
jgi:hypothetical protein